jgi:hypothetical protein
LSSVRQQALTLVAPIAPGQQDRVEAWLREQRRALQRALERSRTTHFARWVVVPPSVDERGAQLGDQHLLAFESNFDGSLDEHVVDLRSALGPLLDAAFEAVEGYPGSADVTALSDFFRSAASQRAAVYYVAHAGLSVPVVQSDAKLKLALEARIRERSVGARCEANDALELAGDLQQAARRAAERDGLHWGTIDRGLPAAPTGWRASLPAWLVAALARPFTVLGALLAAPWFEYRDERLRPRIKPLDAEQLRRKRDLIGREEDRVEQNGITHLVPIKPGRYRSFALAAMVYVVTAMAEAGARLGNLGGITSIHFARWVVLRERTGSRLLFFSNYDGSWEAYLGDFIDKASMGLTMIWTNTLGYPKTHLLLFKGARDEPAFKRWTRDYQVPTQVWYSAYPTLSVQDVLKNAEIRELLASELTLERAERLLGLL